MIIKTLNVYFYEGKGWGFLAGVLRGILSIPAGIAEVQRYRGTEVQRYRGTVEVQESYSGGTEK